MSEATPQCVIDYFGQEIKRRRYTFTKPEEDLEFNGFRLTITSEPSIPIELLDTDRPFVAQIVSSDRAFPFCFFRYEDVFGNKRELGEKQMKKITDFLREQPNTIEKQFIAWIHEQEVDPELFHALSCQKLIFTIDGINGSGKTTCLNAIRTFLIEKGIRPIVPILDLVGTGELGQAYKRDLKLGENRRFTGELDKLVARAACLDTVKNYVSEALKTSNIVAISRWSGSYFAYQEVLGAGRAPRLLSDSFKQHHRELETFCHPSFSIYCDSGNHNGERIQKRGEGSDLHEQLEIQEKIREMSLIAFQTVNDYINKNDGRVVVLDTSCDKLEMMKRAVNLFVQEVKRTEWVKWVPVELNCQKDPESKPELVRNDQPEDKNVLAVKIAEKACEELKKLLLNKKDS